MADGMKIVIDGMRGLEDLVKDLPANIFQLVHQEIQDGAEAIAAEAKQRAPVNDGILKNMITVDYDGPMSFTVSSRAS